MTSNESKFYIRSYKHRPTTILEGLEQKLGELEPLSL